MNPEIKTKWVEALRSGDYKQGRSSLKMSDKYCCLGVLCDIMDPEGWTGSTHYGRSGTPARELAEKASLNPSQISNLVWRNDRSRESFEHIADYIEDNL